MLKNVSSAPVALRWGGKELLLLPGESCRYKDPRVELRQKAKHGAALEHTPEPPAPAADEATVVKMDAPAPAPEPESAPALGALTCNVCAFEAKTPAGLTAHVRKHAT